MVREPDSVMEFGKFHYAIWLASWHAYWLPNSTTLSSSLADGRPSSETAREMVRELDSVMEFGRYCATPVQTVQEPRAASLEYVEPCLRQKTVGHVKEV